MVNAAKMRRTIRAGHALWRDGDADIIQTDAEGAAIVVKNTFWRQNLACTGDAIGVIAGTIQIACALRLLLTQAVDTAQMLARAIIVVEANRLCGVATFKVYAFNAVHSAVD